MEDLFKAAGFSYADMEVDKLYAIPDSKIRIKTFNLESRKTEYDRVTGLFYKGEQTGYFVHINGVESFFCTKEHMFFDASNESFVAAKNLPERFVGLNEAGENVGVELVYAGDDFKMPILDIQVEKNHSYMSGGVLSHNSFGGTAKVFSNGLKYINPHLSLTNTSMIVINQERDNIGAMWGPSWTTTGGKAIKYYASWRARITRIDDIKEKGSTTGIIMRVRNTKNKIGIPKRDAELELRFASGFDSDNEYLKFVIDLGLVEQRKAWFSNESWNFKGAGRKSVADFLNDNPELFESVKNTVNAMLCGETVIDRQRALEEDEDEDEEALDESEDTVDEELPL